MSTNQEKRNFSFLHIIFYLEFLQLIEMSASRSCRRITHRMFSQLLPQTAIYRRSVNTSAYLAKNFKMATLSDNDYYDKSSIAMERLTECLEDLGEQVNSDDYDVEYSSGVLTLKLGTQGIYVINKQPPNKQIWLSSPFSGPERYDFDAQNDTWFCRHTDESLGALLGREISEALDISVKIPIN